MLVCPAYGSAESRRHWRDTLEKEVAFEEGSLKRHLSASQLEQLLGLHPAGAARFWGATSAHDTAMSKVCTGDVALFTGMKRVLAVGEVGAIFANNTFADALWPPGPGGRSWKTVYSLRDFTPASIPYETLAKLLNYSENYGFPGQLVVHGSKAQRVVDGLGITTRTVLEQLGTEEPPSSRTVRAGLERHQTPLVSFVSAGGATLYRREEQPLVMEFCATLKQATSRFYCPVGVCDIYAEGDGDVEIIEAKSSAGHSYVREAVSQLLDYAPYSPRPVDRLAVLLPDRPERRELSLLHRYGIDCIYRVSAGTFERSPASDRERQLIKELIDRRFHGQ